MFNRSFMAGITQTLPVPPPVDVRTMLYNTYLAILNIGGGGLPEIFTVQTTPSSVLMHGTYFVAYDENGSVAIQMRQNTLPVPTPPVGVDRVILVSFAYPSPSFVLAGNISSAVAFDSSFTTALTGASTVTITNAVVGPRTDAADVDTGFTITTIQQGTL